jgi:hypothetical protein
MIPRPSSQTPQGAPNRIVAAWLLAAAFAGLAAHSPGESRVQPEVAAVDPKCDPAVNPSGNTLLVCLAGRARPAEARRFTNASLPALQRARVSFTSRWTTPSPSPPPVASAAMERSVTKAQPPSAAQRSGQQTSRDERQDKKREAEKDERRQRDRTFRVRTPPAPPTAQEVLRERIGGFLSNRR